MSLPLEPATLLAVARQLAADPTPESRRRAISTAYYALFHRLAAYAADRFVGPGATSRTYAIFYRSLDHTKVRSVLLELSKSSIRTSYRRALGRTTSSPALRDFATTFAAIQEQRQLADYDPLMATPLRQDVEQMIDETARALEDFDALDPVERDEAIALIIAGSRA